MLVLGPDGEPLSSGFDKDPGVGMVPEGVGMIVNETGLPDNQVQYGITSYFQETALSFQNKTSFQTYANRSGSLLARADYKVPKDVFEEMCLARDLAEKDDDCGATIGAMIALAFGQGMQNTHRDEVTQALYDEVAKNAKLDGMLKEMYREYLVTGQLNTVSLFTRESFSFIPDGAERFRTRSITAPLTGVLPAEYIRVLNNDIFGTGELCWLPQDEPLARWLRKRFNPQTTAGELNQMRAEDPVAYAMFVAEIQVPFLDESEIAGQTVYKLNPRMVHRTTMPKGAWKYPRPPMTRNFPLLEAKRLLNIMDYALLQGGANFLVVAKKGTDARPAIQGEIENLKEVVRRASHTGVIVGDHRLDIEIITPELTELLSADKRRLIGRKLAMAMLRLPEHMTENAGSEGMKAEVELLTRVVESDRRDIKRHIEGFIYDETARRNPTTFLQGAAKMWFPRIILQGTQYFTDYILKMRDRGDISRQAAVEAGGFDYVAQVQQRRREHESGDDDIMTMPEVPHDSPTRGPNPDRPDNGPGRPRGTSPNNGAPGAKRISGEAIRAIYDDALDKVVRVGELTEGIMEEYSETLSFGRVTRLEREAVEAGETAQRGPVIVVPVNPELESDELQAVRLDAHTALIVATRKRDGAKLTKAISFKEPHWSLVEAENRTIQWGFEVELSEPEPTPENAD